MIFCRVVLLYIAGSILLLPFSNPLFAQHQFIEGAVHEKDSLVPISGATIKTITEAGAFVLTADKNGNFRLPVSNASLPVWIEVGAVGYQMQKILISKASENLNIHLQKLTVMLEEVVTSASRIDQRITEAPVSVEKMTLKSIGTNPSMSFYDGLISLKGMEAVTSSITYKQLNSRGFNSTGNPQFLQLIDGVDNQTPSLNFAAGNLFGVSDLDIDHAEFVPGAASALYGPVAFNGLLAIATKDPFKYPGLALEWKTGANHFGETAIRPQPLFDLSARYANAWNRNIAIKINVSYLKGTDWFARNYTNVNDSAPLADRGAGDPARDALNIYGDEVSKNIPGIGVVSRTGYEEKDLMDYQVYSFKSNFALHYKFNDKWKLIYQYNYGQGTASFTGSSRFSLNDYILQTHRLEFSSKRLLLRIYRVSENTNHTYNTRSLAQLINRNWVLNLEGEPVSATIADATWFERYEAAFKGSIQAIPGGNAALARKFADQGRFLPGSAGYTASKQQAINSYGLSGAGIFSTSEFQHADLQYDLKDYFKPVHLITGGSLRNYRMFTNGSLFNDTAGRIGILEYSTFLAVEKKLMNNRLKVNVYLRYDKNENFKAAVTPRFAAVYTLSKLHHFRLSYQTGFLNPAPAAQFIHLNAGPIVILGGAPANSRGLGVYENSYTGQSATNFNQAVTAAINSGISRERAIVQNKQLLVKSMVAYLQPERQSAFELGYRSLIAQCLMIDLNYYHSYFQDFFVNTIVVKPNAPVNHEGSIGTQAATEVFDQTAKSYQLYTNSSEKVAAEGFGAGLKYLYQGGYELNVNTTFSLFRPGKANINNIAPFNTPQVSANLVFSRVAKEEGFGFAIAWHYQSAFDWYGTLNRLRPGRIEAYSLVDAQVSRKFTRHGLNVKLGGSNVLNKQICQTFGSPTIGAVYYVSFLFDSLLK